MNCYCEMCTEYAEWWNRIIFRTSSPLLFSFSHFFSFTTFFSYLIFPLPALHLFFRSKSKRRGEFVREQRTSSPLLFSFSHFFSFTTFFSYLIFPLPALHLFFRSKSKRRGEFVREQRTSSPLLFSFSPFFSVTTSLSYLIFLRYNHACDPVWSRSLKLFCALKRQHIGKSTVRP